VLTHGCLQVTRAYLYTLMSHKEASGCALLTVHNVAFQLRLMKNIRNAIKEDRCELDTQNFTIIEISEILNKTFQFHKN
jgi:tRNA-guanine family transglycosylase